MFKWSFGKNGNTNENNDVEHFKVFTEIYNSSSF